MTSRLLRGLPAGARFIGFGRRTEYEVTVASSAHTLGWVEVRDLSMTDEGVSK